VETIDTRELIWRYGSGGASADVDVGPAVVVVIDERDAGTWRVEDRGSLRRAGAMAKSIEAGLFGDVRSGGAMRKRAKTHLPGAPAVGSSIWRI